MITSVWWGVGADVVPRKQPIVVQGRVTYLASIVLALIAAT